MDLQSIVVGTDGSANAQKAVEAAADLGASSGATVHVVCAYNPKSTWEYEDILLQLPEEFRRTYDPSAKYRRLLGDAEAVLEARGVDHVGHLVPRHPVAAILDIAEEHGADLIVVGSRGRGWATRAFRGSVSSRIAAHAEGSVLIVHEPVEEAG